MKYRYMVSRDDKENQLIVKEFTRWDNDEYEWTGTQRYDGTRMEAAVVAGASVVAAAIRTNGLFPPAGVTEPLVRLVMDLYGPNREETSEGHVDELDVVQQYEPRIVEQEDQGEEEDALLADEELDETVLDEEDLKHSLSPLEIDSDDKDADILDE